MKKRRLVSLFLSFLLLLPLFSLTSADAYESFDLDARAGLLIEADTGEILYEKNAHQENYPASLTKIMTALLVFEAIDEGRLSLNDSVTATESALNGLASDGSTANIVAGETMTVEQLLNCMLIVSANEACNILAEAEGAKSIHDQILTEEESRRRREQSKHSTISYEIAAQIEAELGQEARVTVPGHYQRGGPPCPYDRVLATQFGTAAADLIVNKQYGRMVAIQNGHIVSIPLEEAASKTKFLPTDHPLIQVARDIGICFGD